MRIYREREREKENISKKGREEKKEYQQLSGKMIKWMLFEVKQHKYKLVLGWVTIWWVVLHIKRRKACYDHNINQERNAGGDSKQLCKQWFIQKAYQRSQLGLSETSPQHQLWQNKF